MAITIVATAGSATANSYLTLTDANAIIKGLVEDDDVTAWSSATDDQKTARYIQVPSELIAKDFLEQGQQIRRLYNGREQESENQTLM